MKCGIHPTAFRATRRIASLLGGDFAGRLSISVRRIRRTSDAFIVGSQWRADHTEEDMMAKFLYVYSGGQIAETPEAQEESMQVWTSWFGSLGDSVVDMGNPFVASSTVTAGGASDGGTSKLSGYSIVSAESLTEAANKAGRCPVLQSGGSVEVYETLPM